MLEWRLLCFWPMASCDCGGRWTSSASPDGRICRPSEHPISWEAFKDDPLTKLLNHSDCDGEIEAADCKALASRLAEVLPKLPVGGGGALDWREHTQKFIDGLLAASDAGESVEFH